ncbi:protein CURVATURE THYLAKOID 1D, chloroplastic [Amborella trichopoda]|uniref:Cyanobacterial aminoacyl-tRNA synthetase CAAD domain-containing protein n=1 Tax=Amborella trichopoda TaxID=13333 RepID=W1P4Q8_AMBTC|nr:protein CURVATURE THYLAKOID 1D, chloroplastic [Amborella trichopoda]ERN02903.1 hypothetical protein AMTR_s00135p00058090 [Amborella trichopoda]|eukprot:XP_006841228.1 protein CURVATURE THYLAKOID 1D, chloroplastic [Amborella trichopoda]
MASSCTPRIIAVTPFLVNPKTSRSPSSLSLLSTPLFHREIPNLSCKKPGFLYCSSRFPGASTSEETSTTTSEEPDTSSEGAAPTKEVKIPEDASAGSDFQANELLDAFNLKLDSENTYSIFLYGGGALLALWISSVIVRALDSIPLFPQVMEVVGLGFTAWFSYRYLIFKKSRDELLVRIEELKQQVIGSPDD